MVVTLCTEDQAKFHAGTNVDSTISTAEWTDLINEAEGVICTETKVNWIDIYGSLNSDCKKILQVATACYSANGAIKHNPNGYLDNAEFSTLLNVNTYNFERAMSRLKERPFSDFVRNQTTL